MLLRDSGTSIILYYIIYSTLWRVQCDTVFGTILDCDKTAVDQRRRMGLDLKEFNKKYIFNFIF